MTGRVPDTETQQLFSELGFLTSTAGMSSVLLKARKAATVSDITVLIEGETGTGKGVLARAIHQLDEKRRAFPFVTAHCSTISEALAESEFFGHERGAFSGAVADRKGLFQAANRGTLLLDDINDLPLQLQPKLLDAIQRGVIRQVGSDREAAVDVRIIAACNQPLGPMVREGSFRSDLYHRLNVITLSLPPLRERIGDLHGLVLSLAKRHESIYSPIEHVEPELLSLMEATPFWGNVRELENSIQRMLFLKTSGTALSLEDWLAQAESEPGSGASDIFADVVSALWLAIVSKRISYSEALQQIEKRLIEKAVGQNGATRRDVAKILRTSERNLYYKMRSCKIIPPAA